ncbi:MAG TPA: CHAD domain-containing protein [Candidatus Binatia bacterium]|nr:CHAD domain-containing protein [Candidatus Binatia bacterium]
MKEKPEAATQAAEAPSAPAQGTPQHAHADAAGLSKLVKNHLHDLSSVLGDVLATGDADAVHDLRVVTRRLQQVLSTLSPSPTTKRVQRMRRALRRVRRALGSWRNYDVILQTVADRRKATRSPRKRAAWKLVEEYLEKRRVAEMIRARRRLLDKNLSGLADRLDGVIADLLQQTQPWDVERSVLARVGAAWRDWQVALARAEQTCEVATVHGLRIATKRLRYRVELARALGDEAAEPVLEWAREVQRGLGDWHDHQVLQQLMAESFARPEILLGAPDVVRVALAELERERLSSPAADPTIVRRTRPEEGRDVMARWPGWQTPSS